jgi:uncharacterized membrane protein YdcZ (DUF606 family)
VEVRLRYLIMLVIALSGAGLAIQAATNAYMREVVQAPTLSALINFVVGGATLAVILALGTFGRDTLSTIGKPPW